MCAASNQRDGLPKDIKGIIIANFSLLECRS